jgi:hypothetical protein
MGDPTTYIVKNLDCHKYIRKKKFAGDDDQSVHSRQLRPDSRLQRNTKLHPEAQEELADDMTDLSDETEQEIPIGSGYQFSAPAPSSNQSINSSMSMRRKQPAPIRAHAERRYEKGSPLKRLGGKMAEETDDDNTIETVTVNNIAIPVLKGQGPFSEQLLPRHKQEKKERKLGQLIGGETHSLSRGGQGSGDLDSVGEFGPSGQSVISGQEFHGKRINEEKIKSSLKEDPDYHPFAPGVGEQAFNDFSLMSEINIGEIGLSNSQVRFNENAISAKDMVKNNLSYGASAKRLVSKREEEFQPFQLGGPGVSNLLKDEPTEFDSLRAKLQNMTIANSDDHTEVMMVQGQGPSVSSMGFQPRVGSMAYSPTKNVDVVVANAATGITEYEHPSPISSPNRSPVRQQRASSRKAMQNQVVYAPKDQEANTPSRAKASSPSKRTLPEERQPTVQTGHTTEKFDMFY